MIYLADITAYNLTANTVEILRFCTGSGVYNNADQYYEPRIEQPALMNRQIFSDGAIGGAAQASYGELTLINNDGELDYLIDYAFNGRALSIYYIDAVGTVTVLKAVMDQAAFEQNVISIRLKDRMADLDQPIQKNTYGGTNALPLGVDGVSDLKGAQKPKLFGRCNNISPISVNTSKLIYQVNDGAITDVVNVFDKGNYLGRGADYASLTEMYNTAPAAGEFRVLKSAGLIRLGASPAGQVTATIWQSNSATQCTAAQVIYQLVIGAGIAVADTVSADFATLDSQNAGGVGLFVNDAQSVTDAINKVATSAGAYWGFDNLNRFRVARLDLPSGVPVASIAQVEILEIQRQNLRINSNAAPIYKVTLTHDVNWTPQQDSSLAGIVPTERRTWLAEATRQVIAQDSAVKTAHPSAQEITYDTLLAGAQYAQPEANRRLALLKNQTAVLTLTIKVDSSSIALYDLGVVVSVQHKRFGLSAGKLFRVIGLQTDYQQNQLQLTLWG